MAIKRVTYNTLSYLVAEIKDRYAEKSAIGALGGLDKVAVENLADDLKNLINGKANTATTLAGYGITDGMTATEIASAISTAIAGTDHLSRVMVDSTADINVAADGAEKKIYMVKNTDGEAGNLYSEYMVIDGKPEKVGDWKVDLSSYAKTTEVTAAIANALTAYAKTADVTKAINAAVAGLIQLDDLSVASTGAGNVVTGLAYDNKTEAQAMGLNETGGFINSIKATDVKGDDTEKYVEIYPQGRAKHGNDRKGDKSKVRYATIGFVAEYGTSSHAARPYMTVANEKAHEKVVEAQRSIWESETGE